MLWNLAYFTVLRPAFIILYPFYFIRMYLFHTPTKNPSIYLQFATKLKEEHMAEIVNIDDGQEEKMENDERIQWDQYLPMSKKEVGCQI